MKTVCRYYNLQEADLYDKRRKRAICEPRMIVITLLRTVFGFTLWQAGLEYGQSNASALHAIKTIRNLIVTDKTFNEKFNKILNNLIHDEDEREQVIMRILDEDRKDERYYKEIYQRKIF
jgi:hypothetical protein